MANTRDTRACSFEMGNLDFGDHHDAYKRLKLTPEIHKKKRKL
jgi:hypothetical protein